MRLAVVGVGDAGCRIANRIVDTEEASGRHLCRGNTLLINAGQTEFDTAERVPPDRRLAIGAARRAVNEPGIDGDPERGVTTAREERSEIIRAFDRLELFGVDAALLVAGLGRGTGGGAGAVVLEELQAISDRPVYALGVLPSEAAGRGEALHAARSLQSFVAKADSVIAFDNEAWCPDVRSPGDGYGEANGALAARIVTLFATGETGSDSVTDSRIDPRDVMRALEPGGLASIGFASTGVSPARGGSSRLGGLPWPSGLSRRSDQEEDDGDSRDAAKLGQLVRRATRSKLTLPCAVSSAERALILRSGPSRVLAKKGFESGRQWLEREADTVEVIAVDEPHEQASELAAAVLLSNVTEVPRIHALQDDAVGG